MSQAAQANTTASFSPSFISSDANVMGDAARFRSIDRRRRDGDDRLVSEWWETADAVLKLRCSTMRGIVAKAAIVRAIARDTGDPSGPLEQAVASLLADLLAYAKTT